MIMMMVLISTTRMRAAPNRRSQAPKLHPELAQLSPRRCGFRVSCRWGGVGALRLFRGRSFNSALGGLREGKGALPPGINAHADLGVAASIREDQGGGAASDQAQNCSGG